MAKRRRESDSDGTTTTMAEYNTVFVDTSLDTYLAMLVSKTDTVSDFKKKMVLEHMQCFPKIGEIQIHSMKVKRRAKFYHLPDIMLVWSAFHGVKGNWFLSADAFPVCHLNQNLLALGTSDGVKMDVRNVDDKCMGLSSDVNRIPTLTMPLPDGVTEKNVVSEMTAGPKIEKSLEKATDFQSNNNAEENCMGTEPRAKKKRKMKHTEDACNDPSLKDNCASSQPEIVGCRNSMVDAVKECPEGMLLNEQHRKPTMSEATAEVSGVRNDQSDFKDRVVFEGTSGPTIAEKSNLRSIVNSQNLLDSDKRKEDVMLESIITENFMASNQEKELGQDVLTEHSGGAAVKLPNLSAGLMDTSGAMEDVNSDGYKRKKKKAQKTAAKIQDTSDMQQTRKGQSIKSCTEIHKSDKEKEEKGLSLNHDHEVTIPSYSKASNHADPDLTMKEASFSPQLFDTNVVLEPKISSGSKKNKKKKKKGKKPADTNQEKSGVEQTDNGISGLSSLLCPSTDHILGETDKGESILKGKDVQMKLLDNFSEDATEKVRVADRNEADFVRLTQTEQTLEDVAAEKTNKEKKSQSPADNCDADFPSVEKENQSVELNQAEKNSKNTDNKDKKAKKKMKKRKLNASDVQENLPIENQKFGIEALKTKENSSSFINSEQERGHVASSQVLSLQNEEKLEEMHGTAVNTVDLARTSENEGEGINFKQYFVPGQYPDKVDSGEDVTKTSKSNEEMKTGKKVKEHGLPSVSISTGLQNSLKPFENQESENKSRVRKASGRRHGDSAQNSDWGEVNPNSITKSVRVSGNVVKDSSPSEMWELTTLQKPDEILAASSHPKEKNQSFNKSSTERSETYPKNRGNYMLQSGSNVANKMVTKTPQKKSLFTKSGTIFQDNSDESSGDENGIVHSDARTRSPLDSSSLSGYSVGESDLSQDSTRNGSYDAKGISTGGENMSKLDISASKDITMDMILRSSKRFKKAKLQASQSEVEQNESQQVESVPDSQANL